MDLTTLLLALSSSGPSSDVRLLPRARVGEAVAACQQDPLTRSATGEVDRLTETLDALRAIELSGSYAAEFSNAWRRLDDDELRAVEAHLVALEATEPEPERYRLPAGYQYDGLETKVARLSGTAVVRSDGWELEYSYVHPETGDRVGRVFECRDGFVVGQIVVDGVVQGQNRRSDSGALGEAFLFDLDQAIRRGKVLLQLGAGVPAGDGESGGSPPQASALELSAEAAFSAIQARRALAIPGDCYQFAREVSVDPLRVSDRDGWFGVEEAWRDTLGATIYSSSLAFAADGSSFEMRAARFAPGVEVPVVESRWSIARTEGDDTVHVGLGVSDSVVTYDSAIAGGVVYEGEILDPTSLDEVGALLDGMTLTPDARDPERPVDPVSSSRSVQRPWLIGVSGAAALIALVVSRRLRRRRRGRDEA